MKNQSIKTGGFWAIIVVILIIIGYVAGGDKSNEKSIHHQPIPVLKLIHKK